MGKIVKIGSSILSGVFFFSCNFCVIECAFASEEHGQSAVQAVHAEEPHHDSDEGCEHSGSHKHDVGSLCCSSLVAVKTAQDNQNSIKLVKNLLSQFTILEKFFPGIYLHFEQKFEFPSGASPPVVFFLNHGIHAPPISL